ncbi:MAG: murein biosynthesis integral membrane protein MurJ [Lentisphaeria bacterium]
MGRSMRVVSLGVLLSRLLGLARDMAFARVWGTGLGMSAWVFAFTIPNLFRALFGEGAFTSAFIPIFSAELVGRGKEAAWRAACRVVSVLAVVLGGLTLLAMVACWCLAPFLAKPVFQKGLELTPALLPYAVLVCVAGALAGVLNTLKRFTVPAFTPLLLNLLLLAAAGVAWLANRHDGQPQKWIVATIPAVLLAGFLHVWIHLQVVRRREGLRFRFDPDFQAPEVRKIMTLMAPVMVGTGMIQLNVLVDRLLAGWLGEAAITSLYYSQRLIYLPVGLFGVAASVVLLPAMARAWAAGDQPALLRDLRYSLRHVWFMSLPMAVMLGWLGRESLDLMFGGGRFDEASLHATWWALVWYVPGIPFFALVKPAAAAFHARQDTRTPVRVAWGCMLLNLALNLTLMWPMRQGGLALATSLSSGANLALLLILFRRQTGLAALGPALPAFGRVALAAATMIPAAWAAGRLAHWFLPLGWNPRAFLVKGWLLALPLAAGYGAFLLAALLLRCAEVGELAGDWRAKLRRRRAVPSR